MKKTIFFLSWFITGSSILASPLFFQTKTAAASCFSSGKSSKETKDFYKSKLSPEEKTKIAEGIAESEARSLYQSIECVHKLGLSKEEKETLLADYRRHIRIKEALFENFQNFLLADEKTIRLSAFEEKNLKTFLSAKKELMARLSKAELDSLSEKPLPMASFTNTYLALLFQHWEFYQSCPDFLKEGLFD